MTIGDAMIHAFMGKKVRQKAASSPEFAHNIGRESVVIQAFFDEKDMLHLQTEDGVWYPYTLLEKI